MIVSSWASPRRVSASCIAGRRQLVQTIVSCAWAMPTRADPRMRTSWEPSDCLATRYCPTVAEPRAESVEGSVIELTYGAPRLSAWRPTSGRTLHERTPTPGTALPEIGHVGGSLG